MTIPHQAQYFDFSTLRRATRKDLDRLLRAEPKIEWQGPKERIPGVRVHIESNVFVEKAMVFLQKATPRPRGNHEVADQHVMRQVTFAQEWTRSESLERKRMPGRKPAPPQPVTLSHPKFGSVALMSDADGVFHFQQDPDGIVGVAFPNTVLKTKIKTEIARSSNTVQIRMSGPVRLEIDVALYPETPSINKEAIEHIWTCCIPGLHELTAFGFPRDELIQLGVPKSVEVRFHEREKGEAKSVASHRIVALEKIECDPNLFAIPRESIDLRRASKPNAEDETAKHWCDIATVHRSDRTPGTLRRAMSLDVGGLDDHTSGFGKPVRQSEPEFPKCGSTTFKASSALELRQTGLDGIEFLVNLLAQRVAPIVGNQLPNDTKVRFAVNWLQDFAAFSAAQANGDGLFCLLRDPPSNNDPLSGGQGLLDQLALSMAKRFMENSPPIPFGGADDPITLPAALIAEINALAADTTIQPETRFDLLSASTQVALREAVLAQRLGTFTKDFEGDFGETVYPNEDIPLVHTEVQLERLRLRFPANENFIQRMLITQRGGDANRPEIDVRVKLARLTARMSMERWPGAAFWVTAAGALVVAGIASAAVGPLILTLVLMGPLGWLVLGGLVSSIPTFLVGGIAFLALVLYLVWDVTLIRARFVDTTFSLRLVPTRSADRVTFGATPPTISGEITFSVNSQIPSGVHQIFDALINTIVLPGLEQNVLDEIAPELASAIDGVVGGLPHLRLTPPFSTRVTLNEEIPLGGVGALLPPNPEIRVPEQTILASGAIGLPESLITVGALAHMDFHFPGFAPVVTQTEPDLRETLQGLMQTKTDNGSDPWMGWALSQNVINAYAYAQWIAGRYERTYSDPQLGELLDVINASVSSQNRFSDVDSHAHVWAATAPQLFVSNCAYAEDPRKTYLHVQWPDIRLCFSGILEKPTTLEVRFSATTIGHLAFGSRGDDGKFQLLSFENAFVHLRFDGTEAALQISPLTIQDISATGPLAEIIATLSDADKVALLDALSGEIRKAAIRLLRRWNTEALTFTSEDRFDKQTYQQVFFAEFIPVKTSVYVTLTPGVQLSVFLPFRDEQGAWNAPNSDFRVMTCQEGIELRELANN